ncbi:hypothetical protein MVEN_00346600 [Mycena venus]|uniref:EML-like second beta-propeller domain-containing protein n=1 Tax=Mycena venus TaxID=2733690 RepID=A0A8H7D9R3_9AGAR|nr:hypothetical protein MVEN_00346600 [Mycena venus]
MSSHPLAPVIATSTLVVPIISSPAPLVEDLGLSPAQTAWTNLKEVLKAVRDASDLFLPPQDSSQRSHPDHGLDRYVNDEFVRIANNVKGFQGIFSQYDSEQEISPAMRSRLDAVISELNSIKGAIDSKMKRGQVRRALEAAGDVDKVVIAFKRLGEVINRFQLNIGLHIEHSVESIATSTDFHRVLRLHDIESNIVRADISLYLTNRLKGIQTESSPMLPLNWATPADIEVLTDRAGKLFIYAFTAVEYLRENPRDRLQALISIKVDTKGPLTKPLDDIYSHILWDSMNPDRRENQEIALTKQILAAILTVRKPLSIAALGSLLKVDAWQVREMLARLHAVIHVPADDDKGVLSTFHASFGDFLTTIGRAPDKMLINPSAAHAALFSDCIQVMGSELHFNVSKCPTSYFPNITHEFTIPALLQYVCLNWPYHIAAASATEASDVEVFITMSHLNSLQEVFFPKFLFWVEVLSAINKASSASTLIMKALTAKCFARAPAYMTEFLTDANEFVVSSLEAIETSVAHIYISALPCLRPTSNVAKAFWPKFDHVLQLNLRGIQRRQEAALILKSQAAVQCIAVSSDGAHIASGSEDTTICVWDARTGEAIMKPIQGHTNTVHSVAFSPDGVHIASGSNDHTICVWDARTGKAVMGPIQGHTDCVQSIAFSPNGAYIASGSDDKTICVWDARTGKAIMEPIQGHTDLVIFGTVSPDGMHFALGATMEPIRGHRDSVLSVTFSPDGAYIASGSKDKKICVWDARTGKAVMKPILGHTNWVQSVAFSPDGAYIASGSYDKTICVWDARTGEAIMKPIQGHTSLVFSVAFSPDGMKIASGLSNSMICVWDAKTGEAIMEPIQGHTGSVLSVAFMPDSTHIVSGSNDNTIRVWDARTREAIMEPIQGHTSCFLSVAFSPDGAHIASGSTDNTICVWDARTGEAVMEPIQGYGGSVVSVAFSPDGRHIVSGSDDNTICVWDARTGEAIMEPIQGPMHSVFSVAFSPDGLHIASGSVDKTIHVWDVRTGEAVIEPIQGHGGSVWSVAFSPDGRHIVSGSDDNTICVWDARTGEAIMEPIQGHTDSVRSVAFSPDGVYIASGSQDQTIRVWDARTGKAIIEPIQGHIDCVLSVVFSPNGAYIVSGSLDHTICVWNVRTGEAIMEPIQGHTGLVFSVAFSPDGVYIASGSQDQTIRVWDVQTGVTKADKFSPSTLDLSTCAITLPHPKYHWIHGPTESWIRGPNQELIMWVPREYHSYLQLPPRFIITASDKVILDMSRFVHGTDWVKCYTL